MCSAIHMYSSHLLLFDLMPALYLFFIYTLICGYDLFAMPFCYHLVSFVDNIGLST